MDLKKYTVEEELMGELQELVASFPTPALRELKEKPEEISRLDFALKMREDFQTHHNNQMIIDRIAEKRTKANSADGSEIGADDQGMSGNPIRVEMDARVEDLIYKATELQGQFMHEVFEEINLFKQMCR